MNAGELVTHDIEPIRTSDSGKDALNIMHLHEVRHLPVVNNEQFLGLVSEEDILQNDIEEAIGSYSLSLQKPFVKEKDHLYDIMKLLGENKLTLIPVVSDKNDYKGVVTQFNLLNTFSQMASFTETGSVIVIESQENDFSLAEIARIVEMEGAIILSSYITSNPESSKIEITLKLNRQDIQRIIATLERFGYFLKGSFTENDYDDNMKERYDMFMTYMNV